MTKICRREDLILGPFSICHKKTESFTNVGLPCPSGLKRQVNILFLIHGEPPKKSGLQMLDPLRMMDIPTGWMSDIAYMRIQK